MCFLIVSSHGQQSSYSYRACFSVTQWRSCFSFNHQRWHRLCVRTNRKRLNRGSWSGVRWSNKVRKHKPYLPVTITGNVQSLLNQLVELSACVRYQHEYHMMCYTERWLTDAVRDSYVNFEWFFLFRGDRTIETQAKNKMEIVNKMEVVCVCLWMKSGCHRNDIISETQGMYAKRWDADCQCKIVQHTTRVFTYSCHWCLCAAKCKREGCSKCDEQPHARPWNFSPWCIQTHYWSF